MLLEHCDGIICAFSPEDIDEELQQYVLFINNVLNNRAVKLTRNLGSRRVVFPIEGRNKIIEAFSLLVMLL